jgi:hypothetical protein
MASGHVNRTQRPNTWLHRPSLQREDHPSWGGSGVSFLPFPVVEVCGVAAVWQERMIIPDNVDQST